MVRLWPTGMVSRGQCCAYMHAQKIALQRGLQLWYMLIMHQQPSVDENAARWALVVLDAAGSTDSGHMLQFFSM